MENKYVINKGDIIYDSNGNTYSYIFGDAVGKYWWFYACETDKDGKLKITDTIEFLTLQEVKDCLVLMNRCDNNTTIIPADWEYEFE